MKPKILFIEDDRDQVALYKMKFEMEGFEFVSVSEGKLGLAAAKENKPDLIFLDILLPDKNGIEVLKELKKNKETKGIPTVLFTNLSDKVSRESSKKMGAAEYFVKTDISLKDLVDWVRNHIKSA